ncbi:hypothetical protein KC19_2G076300, partial [Ceratodon purpureus]
VTSTRWCRLKRSSLLSHLVDENEYLPRENNIRDVKRHRPTSHGTYLQSERAMETADECKKSSRISWIVVSPVPNYFSDKSTVSNSPTNLKNRSGLIPVVEL